MFTNIIPFDTRKMMALKEKYVCPQVKNKILGPNTFKTRWPGGQGANVLTLCQCANTLTVRSCI